MDFFVVVAIVWLASTAVAGGLGYFGGRVGDSATLGALLGPLGIALAIMLLALDRRARSGGFAWAKVRADQAAGDPPPPEPLRRVA